MIYSTLYIISVIIHIVALYWGLKVWKVGEILWVNSNILNIFKNKEEMYFLTTIFGCTGNLAFIIVKPFYISMFEGHATSWQEPLWMYGHLVLGIAILIWHYREYYIVRDMVNGLPTG